MICLQINLKSVGKLYKIRLELIPMDRKLRKLPSWAVKEVKMKDFNTKETLKFKFNCWLSTEEEDGDLMRERPAVRPGKDAPPRECSHGSSNIQSSHIQLQHRLVMCPCLCQGERCRRGGI